MRSSRIIGSSQYLVHACIVKFGFAADFISLVQLFILSSRVIGLLNSLPIDLVVYRCFDMFMQLRIGKFLPINHIVESSVVGSLTHMVVHTMVWSLV